MWPPSPRIETYSLLNPAWLSKPLTGSVIGQKLKPVLIAMKGTPHLFDDSGQQRDFPDLRLYIDQSIQFEITHLNHRARQAFDRINDTGSSKRR